MYFKKTKKSLFLVDGMGKAGSSLSGVNCLCMDHTIDCNSLISVCLIHTYVCMRIHTHIMHMHTHTLCTLKCICTNHLFICFSAFLYYRWMWAVCPRRLCSTLPCMQKWSMITKTMALMFNWRNLTGGSHFYANVN